MRIDPSTTQRAVRLIHRAVLGEEDDIAAEGFAAIHRWRDLAKKKTLEQWPDALKEIAITITATRREPALHRALWLLIQVCSENELRREDMERLAESLDALFTETSYDVWNTRDPLTNARTVSLTIVRAQCVRLAHEMQKGGITHNSIDSWLAVADRDPIPEVRYALEPID